MSLQEAHINAVDEVSKPTLDFPAAFLQMADTFMHGGATVNGQPSERLAMAPQPDEERY